MVSSDLDYAIDVDGGTVQGALPGVLVGGVAGAFDLLLGVPE